jgi:glutamate dehydrogenase (NADP+)
VLKRIDDSVEGKTATISGSGNVALYCIEKLIEQGAKVVSASDSGGTIHDPDGIDAEKLAWLKDLKEVRRGRIEEYAEHFGCDYRKDEDPWGIPCDLAFPCATQNELDRAEAEQLAKNGVRLVVEGANMPTTVDALAVLREAKVIVAPAKAANAGGVAVSGLEQSQNALRISWSREEVDQRLKIIMRDIHERCIQYGAKNGTVDYVDGANVAGFVKVAEAMVSYGVV